MRRKLSWTGAMALAATVLTTAFGVQGSGAAAEEIHPVLLPKEPKVLYASVPVVQQLPQAAVDAEAIDADMDVPAKSLAELVAGQDMPATMSRDMRCLAGAVYFEARGESLEGQLAVANVVINRAESGRFPDSYCAVVYQPSQFSFVRGRSMPSIRTSSKAWQRAVAVAQIADEGSWSGPADDALYFHATRVSPRWKLQRLARVDNHVFYR